MEEFNSGDHAIQRRTNLGYLRNNTLQRLAESGLDIVGKTLGELLCNPALQQYRDSLLYFMDIWRRAHADHSWKPLTPEQLWCVLTEGVRPVQTPADLFALVCEMLDEIRADIEKGEIPLKELLWQKNEDAWEPREERALQILLADKIRGHPTIRNQRIVSGRELEVGGNHPDTFITCILPTGERAKVYIEVKRQQNEKLLDAPRDQLAEKYLKDPEARYGVYLVGWYGKDRYRVSKKRLMELFNQIPDYPNSLQTCLQHLCDDVAATEPDIDEIKAIVIDVSWR